MTYRILFILIVCSKILIGQTPVTPTLTDTTYLQGTKNGNKVFLKSSEFYNTVQPISIGTGTSGTDFNVSGSPGTSFTLNLPTASSTVRGALSSSDWTTFNNKVSGSGTSNYLSRWTGTSTQGNSGMYNPSGGGTFGIGTTVPSNYLVSDNGIAISGTTPAFSLHNSSGYWANYLSSGEYRIFNSVQGEVFSIRAGGVTTTNKLAFQYNSTQNAAGLVGYGINGSSWELKQISLGSGLSLSTAGVLSNTVTNTDNQNLVNSGKVGNIQTIDITGGTGVSFSIADPDSSVLNEKDTLIFATGTAGSDFNVSGSPATNGSTVTYNLPTASSTVRGALSSADWTTFNNKVSGSGTLNYLSRWTGSTSQGNSGMYNPSGSGQFGIGTTTPNSYLVSDNGLAVSGTTPAISLNNGSGYWANYLSGSQYRIFNSVQGEVFAITSGGVTSTNKLAFKYNSAQNAAGLVGYGINGSDFEMRQISIGSGLNLTTAGVLSSTLTETYTGTVTSVGLSLPAIFTVSGSPVTSSGTLTGTLASQSANLVFASPNGSAGTPTFRALVASDLPAIDHGTTTGLGDDDHPQYHNDTRGDARYYTKTLLDAGQLDNRYYTETEMDAALALKQNNITLTTTGTSGAATLIGSTLNIPNYATGGISGLTTGYIPYATSATAIGNGPLYRLASNSVALGTTTNTNLLGRSGINIMDTDPAIVLGKSTTHYWYQYMNGNDFEVYNPNYGEVMKLHTTGRVKIRTLQGTGNRYVYADASGNLYSSTYDAVGGSGTGGYVSRWFSSSVQDNSGLYNTTAGGGVFGIGTTTPGSYLVSDNGLAIRGTTPAFSLSNTSGYYAMYLSGADYRLFNSTNGEVFTVQGGNIGINNTSPSNKLTVNGTFLTTGVNTLSNLAGSGTRMVTATSTGVLGAATIPEITSFTTSGNTITIIEGGTSRGITAPNLYTVNGSLAGNRTVTMGTNSLTFTGTNNVTTITPSGSFPTFQNVVSGSGVDYYMVNTATEGGGFQAYNTAASGVYLQSADTYAGHLIGSYSGGTNFKGGIINSTEVVQAWLDSRVEVDASGVKIEINGSTGTAGDALLSGGSGTMTYGKPVGTQVDNYSSSTTWTKPTGCKTVTVIVIGGGGGGGSGSYIDNSTYNSGSGGGGGGAGGRSEVTLDCSSITGTVTITVGSGGSGAGGNSTLPSNGSTGTSGGQSSFGSYVKANGGAGGQGGQLSATSTGGTAGLGSSCDGGQGGGSNNTASAGTTGEAAKFASGGGNGGAGVTTSSGGGNSTSTPPALGTTGSVTLLGSGGTGGAAANSGGSGGSYGGGGGGGGAGRSAIHPQGGAGGSGASGYVQVITHF